MCQMDESTAGSLLVFQCLWRIVWRRRRIDGGVPLNRVIHRISGLPPMDPVHFLGTLVARAIHCYAVGAVALLDELHSSEDPDAHTKVWPEVLVQHCARNSGTK